MRQYMHMPENATQKSTQDWFKDAVTCRETYKRGMLRDKKTNQRWASAEISQLIQSLWKVLSVQLSAEETISSSMSVTCFCDSAGTTCCGGSWQTM